MEPIYLIVAGVIFGILLFLTVLPRTVIRNLPKDVLEQVSDPVSRLQLTNERSKLQNEFRNSIIQVLGGAALILGVVVTFATSRASQTALTRANTRTDFNAAVTNLASSDRVVRTAAIRELATLGESDEKYGASVTEILSSFIRERSPWPPPPDSRYPANTEPDKMPWMTYRASDIDTALYALGTKLTRNSAVLAGDLRRSGLGGVNFSSADLGGAHLQGSYLARADLRNAGAYDTDLTSVDFTESKLCGANFSGANFTDANFKDAVYSDSTLWPDGFDVARSGAKKATNADECT
jgi:uncharacterized protein YjbI with pentapeptide repeats